MGSTFLSLNYHIVFSTKDRRPLIRPQWRDRLHSYMGGIIKGLEGIPEAIGGVEDHVHLHVGLRATHCISDLVRELKKASSTWAVKNGDPAFGWQEGYAAFSISWTHRRPLNGYIQRQAEHHHRLEFVEELKQLLARNGVQYDPKYLL